MRFLFMTGGITSFICALAGIILPLVPATPFLLLSAFCFARSSATLHNRLLQHPYCGAIIRDWHNNGSISKSNKIRAISAILLTIVISLYLAVPAFVLQIQIVMLGLVSVFILTRPQNS